MRIPVALLLSAGVALAADPYWVSPTGAASWAAAQSATALSGVNCTTLTLANANLAAGDTVYLRGGTYSVGIAPANSGTAGNPATYAAYTGEEPVITGGSLFGISFSGDSWIKVSGVTISNVARLFLLQNGSCNNEIVGCTFTKASTQEIKWYGYNGGSGYTAWSTNNWFHSNIVHTMGYISAAGNDVYGLMQIGDPGKADVLAAGGDQNSNNTIEDNVFYWGGHHGLELYSRFNVLRRNTFHNEGWMEDLLGAGTNIAYGADSNGKWGNRNFQLYDGYAVDGTYTLVEGNRFGTSGPAPDDDGGDSLTITAPKNIIRYNLIYNSLNNGVLFKIGASSYSHTNRFYNNTVFLSGRFTNIPPGTLWQGANFRWYKTTGANTNGRGNVIVNNILNSGKTDWNFASIEAQIRGENGISNNWLSTDGVPGFFSTNVTDPMSLVEPDLSLTAGSGCIDTGTNLTFTIGAGTNDTVVVLDDALFFQDGTWGSTLAGHIGDTISIGSRTNFAQIHGIDYSTDTVTLEAALTWADGDLVWLYADGSSNVVFSGTAPDIGAREYAADPLVAPTISGETNAPARLQCVVTFDTDVLSQSSVDYGLTTGYGSNVTNATPAIDHSLTLTGLSPNTAYHYRIHATDSDSTTTNTGDYTFTTLRTVARATTLRAARIINQPDDAWKILITTVTNNTPFVVVLTSPANLTNSWGDGSADDVYTTTSTNTHTYAIPGTYELSMKGHVHWIDFYTGGTAARVSGIVNKVTGINGITSFNSSFRGCTGLTSIPVGLFDNCPSVTTFGGAFLNCSGLTSIPSGLFDHCLLGTDFTYAFYNCTSLTSIPTGLFDYNTNALRFTTIFRETHVTNIPALLFDHNTAVTNYVGAFYGVHTLTSASPTNSAGLKLWQLTPLPPGTNCFFGATNMSDYASIPTNWK